MAHSLAWLSEEKVNRRVADALSTELESWRVEALLKRSDAYASQLVSKGEEKKQRQLTQREKYMIFVEAFCRESSSCSACSVEVRRCNSAQNAC